MACDCQYKNKYVMEQWISCLFLYRNAATYSSKCRLGRLFYLWARFPSIPVSCWRLSRRGHSTPCPCFMIYWKKTTTLLKQQNRKHILPFLCISPFFFFFQFCAAVVLKQLTLWIIPTVINKACAFSLSFTLLFRAIFNELPVKHNRRTLSRLAFK